MGQAEAAALVRHLSGTPIDAIYSSPRARTLQTATPVADARGLPVHRSDALDEIDFGDFMGRSFDALAGDDAWRHWNEARATARCPGGETMGEAVARALRFLRTLDGGTIMCVTHCDIIRGVVAQVSGLTLDRLLSLGCDPGSVTTLVFDGDSFRVEASNLRPAV